MAGSRAHSHIVLYFANVSSWNKRCEEHFFQVRQGAYHGIGVVETKLMSGKLTSARRFIEKKCGYLSVARPAIPTEEGGASGGAMMLTKKGLSASTIVGKNEMELEEAQWAGIALRSIGGGDIVYIALYLLPGLGTLGVNAGRLATLTSLMKGLKVP